MSESNDQRVEEMLSAGKSRQVGGGLKGVFIACTHFANQATAEINEKFCFHLKSTLEHMVITVFY